MNGTKGHLDWDHAVEGRAGGSGGGLPRHGEQAVRGGEAGGGQSDQRQEGGAGGPLGGRGDGSAGYLFCRSCYSTQ